MVYFGRDDFLNAQIRCTFPVCATLFSKRPRAGARYARDKGAFAPVTGSASPPSRRPPSVDDASIAGTVPTVGAGLLFGPRGEHHRRFPLVFVGNESANAQTLPHPAKVVAGRVAVKAGIDEGTATGDDEGDGGSVGSDDKQTPRRGKLPIDPHLPIDPSPGHA